MRTPLPFLRKAVAKRALLRVVRSFDPYHLHGFALSAGEWLLLHQLDTNFMALNVTPPSGFAI